jgi:hypothetical protein
VESALNTLASSISPLFSEADIQTFHKNIQDLLKPLRNHSASPPPAPTFKPKVTRSGGVGRPFYTLDLDKAEELRWNNATWADVARYFNVGRQTLYRHMARISDSDIDEIVSGIVLQHPESGAIIVLGHLAAKGIKVPLIRVKDCLRRVDPIGVMLR